MIVYRSIEREIDRHIDIDRYIGTTGKPLGVQSSSTAAGGGDKRAYSPLTVARAAEKEEERERGRDRRKQRVKQRDIYRERESGRM